ncbi:hypothetical protein MHBO_000922 [Bonamia ostreae]|uniref:CFA20 domain-containing protein n=1 Tax=Bonamia ostreae TaxID=126728 RepID=A0ABV2AHB3_9EUKA
MFKNTFQSGFLSVFYSLSDSPLQLWRVEKELDENTEMIEEIALKSTVLKIEGQNPHKNFISLPSDNSRTLGIKLPILVLILKNVIFSFSDRPFLLFRSGN